MEETKSIEAEQKFKDAVEKFNKENNRHIVMMNEYQGGNKPIEFAEKTELYGKTYDVNWTQNARSFMAGHDGNPMLNQDGKFMQDKWKAEFEHACEKYFPDREISYIGEYKDSKTPIVFTEEIKNGDQVAIQTWEQNPGQFLRGYEGNPNRKSAPGKSEEILKTTEDNPALTQTAKKIREVPLTFEEMEQADELLQKKQNALYPDNSEDSPAN